MLDLSTIETSLLSNKLKGYPYDAAPCALKDVAGFGWNVLKADLPFPIAVLKQSALDHNLAWMADFVKESGAMLAPHGKTTMAPQLFQRQLEAGAWGITLANMQQVSLAVEMGLRKIIVANQLVTKSDLVQLGRILQAHPDLELYFLVDDGSQVHAVEAVWSAEGFARPASVLVELGIAGGRTGVRSLEAGLRLGRQVAGSSALRLCGVECYEGLHLKGHSGDDHEFVSSLMGELRGLALALDREGLFAQGPIILSAGGSAAFDLVAKELRASMSAPVLPILRSGCYVTHDSGFYERFARQVMARSGQDWQQRPGLRAALEVWTYVQSLPEPGLAILSLGKRDASFDIDLPIPFSRVSQAEREDIGTGWVIKNMNDQHAYLAYPQTAQLRIGDLIGCGISHPCTTFDKWRWLPLVDDAYTVTGAVKTFF